MSGVWLTYAKRKRVGEGHRRGGAGRGGQRGRRSASDERVSNYPDATLKICLIDVAHPEDSANAHAVPGAALD